MKIYVKCQQGEIVTCKVLKILFESDEINVEFPNGNCEWYKLSHFKDSDFIIIKES